MVLTFSRRSSNVHSVSHIVALLPPGNVLSFQSSVSIGKSDINKITHLCSEGQIQFTMQAATNWISHSNVHNVAIVTTADNTVERLFWFFFPHSFSLKMSLLLLQG